MVRKACLAAVACCPVVVFAQSIGGPRTFPQFRDMAGLSGNGFPVLRDGVVDIHGALTLSTPIAYTLKPGQLVLGGASRSFDRSFRWVNTQFGANNQKSDGTGQVVGAVKTPWGNVTLSHLVMSPAGDSVQHLQFTFANDWRGATWSLGVHDITDRGQAAGDNLPVEDAKNSESFFVVGTKALPNDSYFTAGYGTARYRGPFGSYSRMIGDRSRFFGEYDTFNWNFGFATEFHVGSKKAYLTAGLIRGDLATWTLNFVL
ncbi:MAG: hypothetical protein JST12_13695 [Armatimonadetes bacterium]|nr:hypothetical protein [Armatimonadota bacterium]